MRNILQYLCGLIDHKPGSDWGYGGGDYGDVWCERCNKMIVVPVAQLPENARKTIWQITGKDIR